MNFSIEAGILLRGNGVSHAMIWYHKIWKKTYDIIKFNDIIYDIIKFLWYHNNLDNIIYDIIYDIIQKTMISCMISYLPVSCATMRLKIFYDIIHDIMFFLWYHIWYHKNTPILPVSCAIKRMILLWYHTNII